MLVVTNCSSSYSTAQAVQQQVKEDTSAQQQLSKVMTCPTSTYRTSKQLQTVLLVSHVPSTLGE